MIRIIDVLCFGGDGGDGFSYYFSLRRRYLFGLADFSDFFLYHKFFLEFFYFLLHLFVFSRTFLIGSRAHSLC